MDFFQLFVRNVQAQAPLRVGLDDIAEFPANGIGRNDTLDLPNEAGRQHALHQTPENAADADIHFQNVQAVAAVPIGALAIPMPITVPVAVAGCIADFECDVVDADHFAAVHVDNLLVEQVPANAQHVFVGMVRREDLLAEADAVERDGGDLVVADAQPGPPTTHQKAVDTGRMHQRNQGGVPSAPPPAPTP